jgi:putative serine/threonine protein kinase
MRVQVPQGLSFELHGPLICYPRPDPSEFSKRVSEMERLGVGGILLEGPKALGPFRILGKGCTSLVLKAEAAGRAVALKVRRVDANRPDMAREAGLLALANRAGIGPRLIGASENFLLMELAEGLDISSLLDRPRDLGLGPPRLRAVLRGLLLDAFRLDSMGLDHGELSRADGHIVIGRDGRAFILDFESASTRRRPSNLTSLVHYLFLSRRARGLAGLLGPPDPKVLIEALGEYKRKPSDERFWRLMGVLGLGGEEKEI